jgi:hypothetical protein
MNEKLRKLVRAKFDGLCAFCGYPLGKQCLIWDIEPIRTVVGPGGKLTRTGEGLDNLLPACKSCGSVRTKHGRKMTIQQFRADIAQTFRFLRSGGITATSYGRSIRFGLIVETNNPIVFHFEKVQAKTKQP